MSYDPRDYHVDARTLVSGFLLVALAFCGMSAASMDLPGTVQNGWIAMASEHDFWTVVHCSWKTT